MSNDIKPNSTICFEAEVQPFERIGASYFIAFPYSVQSVFGTNGLVRVKGFINGVAIDRSLVPQGQGVHYLVFSREIIKKAGLKLGSIAKVELQEEKAPKELHIPEELEAVLELEPDARTAFDAMSLGKKRNMALWVDEAKLPETRTKRALNLLNRLLSDEFKIGGQLVRKKPRTTDQ